MIINLNTYSDLNRYSIHFITIVLFFLVFSCSHKDPIPAIHNHVINKKDSVVQQIGLNMPKSPLFDSALRYERMGQNEKAIFFLKKAGNYFKYEKIWPGYIKTLSRQGYNFLVINKTDSAFAYLDKSLKLALEKLPENKEILGQIYFFFGKYYTNLNSPDKAIECYNKALTYWSSDSCYAYLYVCYYDLGEFYLWTLKDYKKAEECYIKALRNKELESSITLNVLARLYYLIAVANHGTGEYAKAYSYIHQAISMYSSIKDYLNLEICFNALGILQYDIGNYNEAIESFKKSIKLNIDRKGNFVDRAVYYLNTGNTYLQKKQFQEAIKYYKIAIPLLQNIDIYSVFSLTDLYQNMGQTYQQLNEGDSCLFCFNKCIEISQKVFGTKHPTISEANALIGKYYEAQKQYDTALYYFQSALISIVPKFNDRRITNNPRFNQIGFYLSLYEILEHKADIFMQRYHGNPRSREDLHTAYQCFSLCDSLMSRQTQLLEYDNSKLKFIALYHKVYEKYLGCLYELDAVEKNEKYLSYAFDIMEKNKAALLQNGLRQAEALSSVDIPKNIREKMEELNKKIIYLEKSISENNQDTQKNTLQQELFEVRRRLEKLKEYLEKTYPIYFNYTCQSNTLRLSYIKSHLTRKQQLIEYFQGDSVNYALSITNDKSTIYKFCQQPMGIDSLISKFQNVISRSPDFNGLAANYQSFSAISYQLYEILLLPLIEKNSSENRQLIIIPEGKFSLIPFDALTDSLPNNKNIDFRTLPYLIKSFCISYGYSANLLFNNIYNQQNPKSKVLAFSATDNSKSSSGSLIGTLSELNEIKKRMDGSFYFGKNATEYNFKVQAPSFKIIHLALHGSGNENTGNCQISFISGGHKNEDGTLYDYELYALKLNARLAVLSACETGAGKYYKGEGIFSMARGFMYAGCPAVVMSYWKINDLNTTKQMGYFYQYLKEHESINMSLRKAKLEFLNSADNISAHPVNWASLNAWGKTDIQLEKSSPLRILLLLSLISIVIILFFIIKKFHKI